jgi:hypothetical protein
MQKIFESANESCSQFECFTKESIEILGNSRWTFDSMNPQSYYDLNTKIFAAEQIANTQ